jgi:epsilon-lactone hydrolase
VLLPEYRLAPEHPYPAGLDDALRAYRWLIERTPARRVVLSGDSSGGGLAMSLLLRIKVEGLPLPGGVALFCPWVDLTLGALRRRHERRAVDASVLDQQLRASEAYLAGQPGDDPVVNALSADLGGLPPLLLQGAMGDHQIEDVHALHDRAVAHGVDSRLELYPLETHVFHLFFAFLPEAADALAQAGAFVREVASAELDEAGGAHALGVADDRRQRA